MKSRINSEIMKPNMPQLKLQVNNRRIKYAAGKLLCDSAQCKAAIAENTKRRRKRKRKRKKTQWKKERGRLDARNFYLVGPKGGRRR